MRHGLALTALAAIVLTLASPLAAQAAVPTATVSISPTTLSVGGTATVVFQFSEAVSGVPTSAVTAPNGVLSSPASSNGGVTWVSTFTPNSGVLDATNVISLDLTAVRSFSTVEPGVGTALSGNYAIDTLSGPTVDIEVLPAILAVNDVASVTMTFSSRPFGVTLADFTVSAGVLSGLTATADPLVFTATFTPATNLEGAGSVSIKPGSYTDSLGNAGSGGVSNTFTVDTLRPTAQITLADSFLTVDETPTVTVVFSEPVSIGVLPTVTNGTIGALSSLDGLIWTSTLIPTANVFSTANAITLDMGGVTDGAGNTGFGTATSTGYVVATVRPTANVNLSDLAVTAGETTVVTVVFNMAVTGLTGSAVTAPGGTTNNWTSADGGVTWAGIFTPAAGITTAGNILFVDLTRVTNIYGNTGVGTADSTAYAVDTAAPSLAIDIADTTLSSGQNTLVTFRFSRAVSGFSSADVSTTGGTLTALNSVDGGRTFSATFTAGAAGTSALITADLSGVTDAVGNPATTSSVSSSAITIAAAIAPPAVAPALASAGADAQSGLLAAIALLLLGSFLVVRRRSRA